MGLDHNSRGMSRAHRLPITTIMPSEMEVASQHCDTVPNKTKDILDTVKIEKVFKT